MPRSTLRPAWAIALLILAAGFTGSFFSPGRAAAATTEIFIAPFGETTGDRLGVSAAGAGDVNGDGYPDVIVGAYLSDAGGADAGRAYLYYGGPAADTTADLIFTGEAAGDYFGYSVSGAGDLNGDGYDDLIVGAYLSDTGFTDAGRAYVFLGGPDADEVADLVMQGSSISAHFGVSVSGAGDVNGDGYDDVIVGENQSDFAGVDAGRACIYYGGPAADGVADLIIYGNADGDELGISVSGAGDVNGDGVDDIIVGAFLNDDGGADAGAAYVYYGGAGIDGDADIVFVGEAANDHFGVAVSGAGDANDDSYDDLLIGANLNNAGGSDAGRAYLYYGGPSVDDVADLILTGESADDGLGYSVSALGDVNDDGYDDFIVGAYQSLVGAQNNAGRIYVYYGGPTADSIADIIIAGKERWDFFGRSVSGIGDIDGDGYDDFVVGATRVDSDSSNVGRAYVYVAYPYRLLSPTGGEQWVAGQPATIRWKGHELADVDLSLDAGATWTTLATGVGGEMENSLTVTVPAEASDFARLRIRYAGQQAGRATADEMTDLLSIVLPADPSEAAQRLLVTPAGQTTGDYLGISVSGAGDLNGDGHADFIVGAHGNGAGRASVYLGGPSADDLADIELTGETSGDFFGYSVSEAGDFDRDGYGDLIVGAHSSDAGGTDAGRAYLYHGGPGADAVADLVLTGEAAGDQFGRSVAGAGDFDGDGADDLIVGAMLHDSAGNDAGRAYVYLGGPDADDLADFVFSGEAAGDLFGSSVSGAGDVDGDGYDDVIVGADQHGAGRAYIFYGGPDADSIADLVLTGEAEGDRFGFSVSGVGDTNADSFDDVLVGAYHNDTGGIDAGRAYLYHGGPSLDAVADLIMTGEQAADLFGYSVSGAGDVNADGYTDVIIGAHSNEAGSAYLYYGGPAADADADLVLAGEATGDYFGVSVSGSGDVTGDGFDDIVVGAYGNDAGGSFAGRAYLYDFARYVVTAPTGGTTWNVGTVETVSWIGAVPADLWLSVDGGRTLDLLRSGVGGSERNDLSLTVPHAPTRYAQIVLTPTASGLSGRATSDSLFTIEASIVLMRLRAELIDGRGITLTWETDPGPADLNGYRLERFEKEKQWKTLASNLRDTSYTDSNGGPGSRYRLTAINGLGEELLLGEVVVSLRAALAAWPLPYRGGDLSLGFATYGGLGGGTGEAAVEIYDLAGRRVRNLVRRSFTAGYHEAVWDGRDDAGRPVASGTYYLRARSAGRVTVIKLVVVR